MKKIRVRNFEDVWELGNWGIEDLGKAALAVNWRIFSDRDARNNVMILGVDL